ncbi:MAG: MarR family transcriptional regulator [Aestuariivirga sp.]
MKTTNASIPKLRNRESKSGEAIEASDSALSRLVGYNLKRVAIILQADTARVLRQFDLRVISFSALSMVVENPGMRQSQLADLLGIERSNLVLVIDELDSRELITRNVVLGDRRSYALKATLAGQRLNKQALEAIQRSENAMLDCLSKVELEQIGGILGKLRSELSSAMK